MAIPTYNRANFLGTQTDSNGVVSTDPINFEFQEFLEFMRSKRVNQTRISASQEGAPDLISWEAYGTQQYHWVVMLVNKIQDPINELTAGTLIALPDLADIEEFREIRNSSSTRGQTVLLR